MATATSLRVTCRSESFVAPSHLQLRVTPRRCPGTGCTARGRPTPAPSVPPAAGRRRGRRQNDGGALSPRARYCAWAEIGPNLVLWISRLFRTSVFASRASGCRASAPDPLRCVPGMFRISGFGGRPESDLVFRIQQGGALGGAGGGGRRGAAPPEIRGPGERAGPDNVWRGRGGGRVPARPHQEGGFLAASLPASSGRKCRAAGE